MTAEQLRETTFADLNALGFRPATSLPNPDTTQQLRPAAEIAARLMALDALFTWVAFPEEVAKTDRLTAYIDRNGLRDWLADQESPMVALPRAKARKKHGDTIGWRLENMWALAWVLGFDPEPDLAAAQVGESVTRPLIYEFLPGLGAAVADLLEKTRIRPTADVIALEYRFYCAHNAVRNAQLGRDGVPPGFHPVVHGGAVHERRHSLTWCLSPGTVWDDTDLST